MTRFTDRAVIGEVKKTPEGYLLARSRALRTGIQDYAANELGLEGNHIVKVYRPPESVFAEDSLSSLAQKPVTIDHPGEDVSPDNYSDLSVGHVTSKFARDGEWIALEVMVTDKRGLDAVDSDKKELSAGYVAEMHRANDGDPYDFVMGPPVYNHIAIVDRARAGSQARIGDDAKPWGAAPLIVTDRKESEMTDIVKVMVGDKAVQVAAADADFIAKMIKDHTAEIETKDEEIGSLKAECAEANAKILTDEQVDALVTERAEAKNRRDAVRERFGDEAVEGASDAEIKGIYGVIDQIPRKTTDKVREGLKDGAAKEGSAWDRYTKKGEKK